MARVRLRAWWPLLALLLVAGAGWAGLTAFERALVGKRHEFPVEGRPANLTDDLALTAARRTLVADGLDLVAYEPIPDDRTTAPDGRRDAFLCRGPRPNEGWVYFRGSGPSVRCVSVELVGERIVCQGSWGK